MQANNATMANIQLNKLRQMYPETIMYRQTPQDTQHRVPLKLQISPAPLYIKITLTNQFPQFPPKIHMMSSVTHRSLNPVTIEYTGQAVQGWNQNSSLATVVKAIHDEFQAEPPMPKQMNMGQRLATSMMQNMGAMGNAAMVGGQQQQPGMAGQQNVEF